MNASTKALFDSYVTDVNKLSPKLYKAAYPRRIIPPNGDYWNPKYAASSIASNLFVSLKGFSKRNVVVGGIDLCCNQLVKEKVPTYFVDPEFLRAVSSSRIEDIDLSVLKFPADAMLFCLPMSVSLELFDFPVPWLMVARIPKGEYTPEFSTLKVNFQEDRAAFFFPVFQDFNLPEDFGGLHPLNGCLNELISSVPFLDDTIKELRASGKGMTLEDDKRLSDRAIKLTIQIILGMLAGPEYVTREKLVRPAKHSNNPAKAQDDLWSANVIGHGFSIKQDYESEPTGRTVRRHLTLGYFRNQHYGPQNSLNKIIWIKSYWTLTPEQRETKHEKSSS